MPHAAIIATGIVIFGVAAYVAYKEFIEPTLERRREDAEAEYDEHDWELERGLELSRLEHEHETQRRADEERWAHSTSSDARYDGDIDATDASLRRRRLHDPFSDDHEMQEVSNIRTNNAVLFDAGPSSRLDSDTAFIGTKSVSAMNGGGDSLIHEAEEEELLQIASSLSIAEVASGRSSTSPQSLIEDNDEEHFQSYSVIEPDSRPASVLSSHSRRSVTITETSASEALQLSHDTSPSFIDDGEQDNEIDRVSTPTLRSSPELTSAESASLERVLSLGSRISNETSNQVIESRPISPFSDLGFVSAHSSDADNRISRPGSALESDKDSQWSDLGEESSDEDDLERLREQAELTARQQEEVRNRRQQFFAGRTAATN